MTLILGIRARDGIVMAADSMSTEAAPLGEGALISKHECKKLIIQRDILWGASGAVGVSQIVHESIGDKFSDLGKCRTAVSFRTKLVEIIAPVVTLQYNLAAKAGLHPGPVQPQFLPAVGFLFALCIDGKLDLLSIEWNMNGEVVVAPHCSIGSGTKTGQALLRRLRNQDWDLKTAEVIAYRTMEDAIHVEPMGIGPPIQLARIKHKGRETRPEMISDEEIKTIQSAAMAWRQMEQDVLQDLQADKNSKSAPTSPPPPPPPPVTH